MSDIVERLRQIADAIARGDRSELTMSVPVRPERDADVVISRAAAEIERLRARVAGLERAIRQMLDVDSEMGIYPAAVSGYNDERDYAQRDGFKNGWNAAVQIYGEAMSNIAVDALAQQEGGG